MKREIRFFSRWEWDWGRLWSLDWLLWSLCHYSRGGIISIMCLIMESWCLLSFREEWLEELFPRLVWLILMEDLRLHSTKINPIIKVDSLIKEDSLIRTSNLILKPSNIKTTIKHHLKVLLNPTHTKAISPLTKAQTSKTIDPKQIFSQDIKGQWLPIDNAYNYF